MVKSDRTYEIGPEDRAWIESLAEPIQPALEAIEVAAEPERIPILDRESGRVLAVLAAGRRRICEIGTAYGYSTLWMALAQGAGATIVTIDPDRRASPSAGSRSSTSRPSRRSRRTIRSWPARSTWRSSTP